MAGASELDRAVDKLIKREKGWAEFKRPAAVGPRPGAVTTGRPSAATGSPSASFAESDYLLREYWPEELIESSDGIFSIAWRPIKKVVGAGNASLQFKQPVEPPPVAP